MNIKEKNNKGQQKWLVALLQQHTSFNKESLDSSAASGICGRFLKTTALILGWKKLLFWVYAFSIQRNKHRDP